MSAFSSPFMSRMLTICQVGPGLRLTTFMAVTVVPLISQTATAPLSFWNTMSALRLKLRSAMPLTCHDGSTVGRAATVLNWKAGGPPGPPRKAGASHSAKAPLSFCHRMPAFPSPSVSPVPTTCQVGPGFWMPAHIPKTVPVAALAMVHIATDMPSRSGIRQRVDGVQVRPSHLPERERSVVVLPEDVASMAHDAPVEPDCRFDMPVRRDERKGRNRGRH